MEQNLKTENQNNSKICPKCGKEYPKKAITCDECNVTLMKKTTYGRIMNDRSSMIMICPKCKKYYEPPIKNEVCDDCGTVLILNDDYLRSQAEKSKQSTKRFNTILAIIVLIIGIALVWGIGSVISSPHQEHIYTCSRCGKTFTDSENTKSIAYSGYCVKCHDDVEFLLEVQEELEKQ